MSLSVETLALAKGFAKSYTDSAISGISGGINYKGAVDYYSNLPNNAKVGDAYTVKYKGSSGTEEDGTEYVWALYEGTNQWIAFGPDMSQFSKVVANPTLSGSEANLTGLEVDGTKYAVGGGSEQHLYWHSIRIEYIKSAPDFVLRSTFVLVLSASPTPYTVDSFIEQVNLGGDYICICGFGLDGSTKIEPLYIQAASPVTTDTLWITYYKEGSADTYSGNLLKNKFQSFNDAVTQIF